MCLVYLFAIQVIDDHISRIAHIEIESFRPCTGVRVGNVFHSFAFADIYNIPTLWYST